MKLVVHDSVPLNGVVSVSGAKNSATRVLSAALLSDSVVKLRNFPLGLADVTAKIAFIKRMGAYLCPNPDIDELEVSGSDLSFNSIVDFNLPVRTTYLLACSTIVRHGEARVPYPAGCKIGTRGYDIHMMVWRALGCKVEECSEYIKVTGRLVGGEIDFPLSTVGGTENALICSAVARGETRISNAYITPEVQDLISFLRAMGAVIKVEGGSHIVVSGVNGLLGPATFTVMPDRIEALTWIVLGAICAGQLTIQNVPLDVMQVPLIHLREAGVDIYTNSSSVQVSSSCIGMHGVQSFEVATGSYPGIVSDMQPFYVILALFARGRSTIHDYRYPERIAYVNELAKFAVGKLSAEYGKIIVYGPSRLSAANVNSTDLRGSMALIMAALCAEGESCVNGVDMALRGYNRLQEKLENLGANVQWIS